MSFYVLRDPLRALAFLKSMGASGMTSDEHDKAPRALRETLLFPYQNGLIWTRRVYGEGGWAGVSKAFTELPQSTEQILHPDKYFAHEAPVKVTLPDLTPLLNRRGQKAESRGQRTEIRSQRSEIRRSADIPVRLSAKREQSFRAATWARTAQPAAGSADVPSALSAQRKQSLPTAGWAKTTQPAAGSADVPSAPSAQREQSLPTAGWARTTQPAPGSADVPSALSAKREQSWGNHRRFSFEMNHAQAARLAWKRIDADVNGEFGLYLLLDQFLKAPAESRRATAGWGGDRSAVYEGPKGEVLFVSLSTWDTAPDAREFFDAYVKRTELRYPGATPTGATVSPRSPTLSRTFRTSEGDVTIEMRGSRVLVLEGVPDRISSNAMAKSLWQ
jgi:hypothetical protein